jgi:adenylylsulfate kinase-like enzyme/predicted RNA-binding Zn-ribbon protein involved in translation (DUF1610 family)
VESIRHRILSALPQSRLKSTEVWRQIISSRTCAWLAEMSGHGSTVILRSRPRTFLDCGLTWLDTAGPLHSRLEDVMINICPQCGQCRDDKAIDVQGQRVICPECGHEHPFRIMPLFIIGGLSGAGKTTVMLELLSRELPVVLLDGDPLWFLSFGSRMEDYPDFHETWLRIAKNVSQAGRPCALISAGSVIPHTVESRVERRYFSVVHYLAFVADDQTLRQRLLQRPDWRGTDGEEFITRQFEFSHWLQTSQEAADHQITVIDTSSDSVSETADKIQQRFAECLAPQIDVDHAT